MQRKRVNCRLKIQGDSFRSGELTQPSQKMPENVVKDALKEKTEHALSSKQVSGDEGDAMATQTVIVEGNEETLDLNPTLAVPAVATISIGDSFDPMEKVKAIDKEDGDLTSKVKVEGEVDTFKAGTYILKYTVTDSKGHEGTAKQTVTVKVREEVENELPILKVPATTTITEGDQFNGRCISY